MGQTAQIKPEPQTETSQVATSVLDCFKNSNHVTSPFNHWLLENVLPKGLCEAITSLPFPPPQDSLFNGKRETNNSTRVYFTPDNQKKFNTCLNVVEGFKDARVKKAIEEMTGTDLSRTRLRIEYCQDTSGFWLEPHTDIFVKKFTMLVYLSDDPNLSKAGTDIHEGPPDFNYVGSAPFGQNLGVIFIPGKNSWHGVGHHPFEGIRKSIIINFVTSNWRDQWELA